jgi:hypothetical protein
LKAKADETKSRNPPRFGRPASLTTIP